MVLVTDEETAFWKEVLSLHAVQIVKILLPETEGTSKWCRRCSRELTKNITASDNATGDGNDKNNTPPPPPPVIESFLSARQQVLLHICSLKLHWKPIITPFYKRKN